MKLFSERRELQVIKAVFFDLYQTLVRYEPPREELLAQALKDFGLVVKPETFQKPLAIADEFMYREIARFPFSQRSKEDKMALFAQHQAIVLKEVGIEASEKLIHGLLAKAQQFNLKLVLYDDVLPVLTDLKARRLVLGLISNVDRDITPLLNELEVASLLLVVVTSQNAGFNKPQPEIFQEALRQAAVKAPEAIYVGDQYQIDVVGANRAGLKGILLDRSNHLVGITDCPRIQSLTQVVNHL